MGVKDLFSPFIRDNATATNTSLKDLIKDHPEKDWIGIDMSILLISAIKSSPNFIDLLFSIPQRPIEGLNDKICHSLSVYVNAGFTIVCVFDGRAHPLKRDHAYISRYAGNEQKEEDLRLLYDKSTFDSVEDEESNISRAKALRKDLATFSRPDLLYSLKVEIKRRFREKAICIGAPFEADHQLGALTNQKITDYVFTNDSDLCVLGTDVVVNTKPDGKCWLMPRDKLMNERLPDRIGLRDKAWSQEVFNHVACFLGNDFVPRIPGNSVKKLEHFIKNITNADGSIKGEDTVFGYIFQTALLPTNCNQEEKNTWDQCKKLAHIKKWKEAKEMFVHGPAFIVKSDDANVTFRDAIKNGHFSVELGSMTGGTDIQWILADDDRSQYDILCNRTCLVGFDPKGELMDTLALREDFDVYQCNNEVDPALCKIIFELEIWSKKGQDIGPLPDLLDCKGCVLFHGSVIDLDQVPARYYSKDQLEFWLQCRQIKAPSKISEIKSLIQIVWELLGNTLPPVPKELMKGKSGYCSPELLSISPSCDTIQYVEEDEFLRTLRGTFPEIDDDEFTKVFGKRNGTRRRALMHVEGGSFDIKQIKITKDLIRTDMPETKLQVICAACAPSQKLKDGDKEKFYEIQLVMEMSSDGQFVQFVPHPCTSCKCPYGCIMCGHLGALVLVLIALCNFNKAKEVTSNSDDDFDGSEDNREQRPTLFDDIRGMFPAPVNDLVSQPMISTYAFSPNGSDKKKEKNKYRNRTGKNKGHGRGHGRGRGRGGRGHSGRVAGQGDRRHWRQGQNAGQQQNQCNGTNSRSSILTESDIQIANASSVTVDTHPDLVRFNMSNDHADILEYALEGIIDATDTPTIKVVSATLGWIRDIQNGRDSKGAELKTIDGIQNALREEATLKGTDVYIAKMIKVQERYLKFTKKNKFKKVVQRNTDDNAQSISSNSSSDGDSEMEEDGRFNFPEPIAVPVIIATAPKREEMKRDLATKLDFDKIPMNILAKDVNIADIKIDTREE